jgi:hypothetical protein
MPQVKQHKRSFNKFSRRQANEFFYGKDVMKLLAKDTKKKLKSGWNPVTIKDHYVQQGISPFLVDKVFASYDMLVR